jgi:DNA polymerase
LIVSIDFESRSAVDLRKTGVYVYADDPSTDIWCMAYAFDDEEPVIWTPDMEIDVRLEDYIVEGGKLRAWNSNFERVIWNKIMVERYRWPRTKTSQWHCTMAQASAMGLPRALGQAAAVLGVEEQKDTIGRGLMMRMARPRKTNEDGTHVWWNTPDKMQALIDYCKQDVRTEVAVAERLIEMDYQERQVFLLDQRINDRGVMLDRDLLQRVRVLADETKEEIDAEISRITSGQVNAITNGVDLVKWLNKYGIATKSVDKQHVARMLALPNLHPVIRHALELRQNGAKSSTAKLDSMEYAAGADDRMRGLLVYHGAATGRWSGKLVQPQNFPRPIKKQDELNEIIAKLKDDQSVADHGVGTQIASDLLRSMIIAKPGHRLLFADYSAIEARVLAWVAGQSDLVETFNQYDREIASGVRKEDVSVEPYKGMAAVVFEKSASDVTLEERQIGKALTLGCGFGMSGKRFAEFAKLDEDLALTAVAAYREKNHRIVSYWKELEQEYVDIGRAAVASGRTYMRVPLASGRCLTYHNPRIVGRDTPWGETRDTLQVDTLNSVTRQWVSQFIWGGLAVENVIQATARDLMAGAMTRLEMAGYPVIMSVHDEIICEVPDNHGTLAEMIDLMVEVPAWAKGCPIAAEGKEGPRYEK